MAQKRATARRDASRQRKDIERRVRQQLTWNFAPVRSRGDHDALKRRGRAPRDGTDAHVTGITIPAWRRTPTPYLLFLLSGWRRRLSHVCLPGAAHFCPLLYDGHTGQRHIIQRRGSNFRLRMPAFGGFDSSPVKCKGTIHKHDHRLSGCLS